MRLGIIGSGMIVNDFLEIIPYLSGIELRGIYGRKSSEEKLNKLKNENKYNNRMISEFIEFINTIHNKDLDRCYKMLDHSLIVSEVQTIARKKAGIVFQSDIN